MKRFVTYLYEYERGSKTRNVGFIRVDIRGSVVNMEISVRKLRVPNGKAKVLGIVIFDGLQSLELGELQVLDGQGDVRLQLPARNIQGNPVSIDDVVGVGIRLEEGSYIASCWKDEYADEMARCEYRPWVDVLQNTSSQMKEDKDAVSKGQGPIEAMLQEQSDKEIMLQERENREEVRVDTEIHVASSLPTKVDMSTAQGDGVEATTLDLENATKQETTWQDTPQYYYRKLDLTHMHILPMQDRHYSSNAFLVHGFWNYGYVVLKTEITGDKKKSWLGVPGIYERPEAAMALAFGFPLFEAVPSEMVEAPLNVEKCFSEKEMRARNFSQKDAKGTLKNQPSNEKLFGCWFVELHKHAQ